MREPARIDRDGFAILPAVFSQEEVGEINDDLQAQLESATDERDLLRSQSGAVYGARNLFRVFPRACQLWRRTPLVELLSLLLGDKCGMVRGLYFDKPPSDSWSLAWHRDLTIAVKDNTLPSHTFRKPTTKAGLPHVEAPKLLLDSMLTLRIHLDDVTQENGPLQVIPGSHLDDGVQADDDSRDREITSILVCRGDVLAMRPRILHGSIAEGTSRHRRILHLEFAADANLADGFQWADFFAIEDQ